MSVNGGVFIGLLMLLLLVVFIFSGKKIIRVDLDECVKRVEVQKLEKRVQWHTE